MRNHWEGNIEPKSTGREKASFRAAGRILRHEPWLIVASLALLIPIVGIVFGTTTHYLARVRQAELEAGLKQDMLDRGMSAEEIRTVIEATSRRKGRRCPPEPAMRQAMRQEIS